MSHKTEIRTMHSEKTVKMISPLGEVRDVIASMVDYVADRGWKKVNQPKTEEKGNGKETGK